MAAPTPDMQRDLIVDATLGFDELLDNKLPEAQRRFKSQPHSAAHGVGLGITAFLQAALGQEDSQLAGALDVLVKAEATASSQSTPKLPKGHKVIFTPGLEYKLMTHDAVMSQALVHILTESYLEFMKAVYKLNRAYKGFKSVYSTVYPGGVSEADSLDHIITKLNTHYTTQLTAPSSSSHSSSGGGGLFGWGRKKPALAELKHSASSSGLPALRTVAVEDSRAVSSEPGSRSGSREGSFEGVRTGMEGLAVSGEQEKVQMGEDGSYPAPAWKGDPIASMCISGAFFGAGLFTLIFSLLPPKSRKLISWFGFKDSNRSVALKQLTVAAATGDDVHGYFASLTLLTFYCLILLMSGWQAEEEYLLDQCSIVLNRVIERFPDGTLWVLNRSKLYRMRRDTSSAIVVIVDALAKGSSFREADSLLVFELGWLYLSDAQFIQAAETFERMCTLNNWSHSTYLAIAAGCLVDLPAEQRTPEINKRIVDTYEKLPSLFGQKRLLGEPPTTEIFIMRRIEADKAKHARWVVAGQLSADSHFSAAVRVTFSLLLGNFWASVGNRSPTAAVQYQIARLSAWTPPPAVLPSESTTGLPTNPFTPSSSTELDLDSPDELAMRDVLLGTLYSSLQTSTSLKSARTLLESAIKRGRDSGPDGVKAETWVLPLALFELAIVECKEGSIAEQATPSGGKDQKSPEVQQIWTGRLKAAESYLEQIFLVLEYDLKGRIESRVIQLRDELATKRKKTGL